MQTTDTIRIGPRECFTELYLWLIHHLTNKCLHKRRHSDTPSLVVWDGDYATQFTQMFHTFFVLKSICCLYKIQINIFSYKIQIIIKLWHTFKTSLWRELRYTQCSGLIKTTVQYSCYFRGNYGKCLITSLQYITLCTY